MSLTPGRTRMTCVAGLAALLTCATGVVACGGTSCGPAYELSAAGQSVSTASCGGGIPARPAHVDIEVGARVSVTLAYNTGGAAAVPRLTASGHALRAVSSGQHTETFEAMHRGTARLIAHDTDLCIAGQGATESCVAFVVRVL